MPFITRCGSTLLPGLTADDMPYIFRVSGSTIKFLGFLALYEDTRDEDIAAG